MIENRRSFMRKVTMLAAGAVPAAPAAAVATPSDKVSWTRPNMEDSWEALTDKVRRQCELTGKALIWLVPNRLGLPCEAWVIPTAVAVPQEATLEYPRGCYRIIPLYPYGAYRPETTVEFLVPRPLRFPIIPAEQVVSVFDLKQLDVVRRNLGAV